MDRKILFRGKQTDNGEWVEGYYTPLGDDFHYILTGKLIIKKSLPVFEHFPVIPETIGQYTGLTDKNGVKIFEGDVVHYQYEPGENYWNANQNSVIEWQSTGFYMQGIVGTNKYALSSSWLESIPHNNGGFFEVIGNIHDNPELIGGDSNG